MLFGIEIIIFKNIVIHLILLQYLRFIELTLNIEHYTETLTLVRSTNNISSLKHTLNQLKIFKVVQVTLINFGCTKSKE